MLERDTKVIGYFAYASPEAVVCSGKACVIAGSEAAMRACLPVAQDKGKILVIGDYGSAQADFLLNDLLLHELELIGSNASAGAWDDALRLATEGAIPLAKLISRTVPAEEFKQGMELARNSPEMIKVVLKWMHDNAVS